LEDGVPVLSVEAGWQQELAAFDLLRAGYFLYD
jgi:hypothetical protein